MDISTITLPDELGNSIALADYRQIVGWAMQHLSQSYQEITYDNGLLNCKREDEQLHLINIINLSKYITVEPRERWEESTKEHLDKFHSNQGLERFLYKDFEYASQHLIVRLCNKSMFESDSQYAAPNIEDYHHQLRIPETYVVLGLDLPDRIVLMSKDKTAEWEQTEEELFAIAYENIAQKLESLATTMREIEPEVVIITLFDSTYAAAYSIDFGQNCANCEGSKGSLVAFPTKGSVFIHPIETAEHFSKALDWLIPVVNEFYRDDPGAINNHIYWFYEDEYHVFPRKRSEDGLSYHIPQELFQLLRGK